MKSSVLSPFISIMVLLILVSWAVAQQTTPQTGGGSGGAGGGATPPKVTPSIPPPIITPPRENRIPQFPTIPETIFIAGTVIQEDGSHPPFGTEIELDCGDTITREATVDSTGNYGFQVGSSNRIGRVQPDAGDRIGEDVFSSATVSQSPSIMGWSVPMRTTPLSLKLLRCEVRAQYPGYRSTSARMKAGSIWGYTEIETILMYRIDRVQGTSVSLISMLAPKEAKKAVVRATKALKKEKLNEAQALLKSAIEIYPDNAEAWYMLGETYQRQDRNREARDSYAKAIAVDRIFVRPYLRLARFAMMDGDWKSAVDLTDEALKLDPIAFPEAYYLNALANFSAENLEAAERSARKGQRLDLDRQYPQMHLILANILSIRQDAEGAMEEMRKYLKAAPKAQDAVLVRARLEEKLAKAESR